MRRGVAKQLVLVGRSRRGDGAARIVDLGAAREAVDHAGARQTSSIARLFHEGEVLIIERLTGPAIAVAFRTVAAIEVAERADWARTVAAAIALPAADRRVLIIRAARACVRAHVEATVSTCASIEDRPASLAPPSRTGCSARRTHHLTAADPGGRAACRARHKLKLSEAGFHALRLERAAEIGPGGYE